MSELLSSKEDALLLKRRIYDAINALEADGMTRGQIGAAMAGIAFGLLQANAGHAEAKKILQHLDHILMGDQQGAVQ